MKDNKDSNKRFHKLRKEAERLLAEKAGNIENIAGADVKELIEELYIHQIELEMQNEDLIKTRQALEVSNSNYLDLYNCAPVGYFSCNKEGKIVEVNRTAAELLGTRKDALLDTSFARFSAPAYRDVFYLHTQQVLKQSGKQTCEMELLRNDDSSMYVRLESTAVQDKQGDIQYIRTALIDISELKKVQEERLKLEQQVQHTQKLESLGILAGGIAHDFNNILTVIIGNANLAKRNLQPGSPLWKKIEKIEVSAERAHELSQQMLAYSGKGKFIISAANLNDVVQDMGQILKSSISKKAALVFNQEENLPDIEADVTQIRQIIMNLITNASEAIEDTPGTITISTGVLDENAIHKAEDSQLYELLEDCDHVFLEVHDTGCGMDKETLAKIFDPFFTTKFTGRGLGLSAVQGILRGHHGIMKVESEPGIGTTFRLLFPARETAREPVEIEKKDITSEWHASGTILLVDDEEMVLDVAKEMLEEIGFHVLTAANGHEAVQVFKELHKEIHCVLLDLTMPQMDGRDTLIEFKKLDKDIPVILSSGFSEQEIKDRMGTERPVDFIQKPYQLDAISKVMYKVLRSE